MSRLFEQIKILYDQELYSNVTSMAPFACSLLERNSDSHTDINFQMHVYYAESLFKLRQFRKAETIYSKALQLKKSVIRFKSTSKSNEMQNELMLDVNIKYKIHQCYLEINQVQQALVVLQSIPGKQRTPKINMALAKLYHRTGMERSATFAYKEVLKECPLALEAAEGLLSLKERGSDVNSLMIDGIINVGNMEWLITWIKALSSMYNREYNTALVTLKSLDYPMLFQNNVKLLTLIGECYYKMGDNKNALTYLQRTYNIDRYMQRGLDLLVAILIRENQEKEIEKYVKPNIELSEYSIENWIALAYYMQSLKKLAKAAYYSQKACILNPRNPEVLILKGSILVDIQKYPEAIVHFLEAMQISPCYEVYKGLVDCYIAQHRYREALSIASNASSSDPNVKNQTLYAMVLSKDNSQLAKARATLHKVLETDDSYLPAVYLLSELYERDSKLKEAIHILEHQLTIQSSIKLHQMLGELYARNNNEEKALDHFSIALRMDPKNRRAIEGLHRIDNTSAANISKLDTSGYDMVPPTCESSFTENFNEQINVHSSTIVEENGESLFVGEPILRATASDREDSETEGLWSDMDLEVGGSQ